MIDVFEHMRDNLNNEEFGAKYSNVRAREGATLRKTIICMLNVQ
jgi:hypothetical protein